MRAQWRLKPALGWAALTLRHRAGLGAALTPYSTAARSPKPRRSAVRPLRGAPLRRAVRSGPGRLGSFGRRGPVPPAARPEVIAAPVAPWLRSPVDRGNERSTRCSPPSRGDSCRSRSRRPGRSAHGTAAGRGGTPDECADTAPRRPRKRSSPAWTPREDGSIRTRAARSASSSSSQTTSTSSGITSEICQNSLKLMIFICIVAAAWKTQIQSPVGFVPDRRRPRTNWPSCRRRCARTARTCAR